MKTAGIEELSAMLREHIALVKGGEEVLVTDDGEPVARLVPVKLDPGEPARLRRLAAKGVVRLGRKRDPRELAEFLASLPVCRVPEGTVQRLMDEERDND